MEEQICIGIRIVSSRREKSTYQLQYPGCSNNQLSINQSISQSGNSRKETIEREKVKSPA